MSASQARDALAALDRVDTGLRARLVPAGLSGRDAAQVGSELGLAAEELDVRVREDEAAGRLVRVGQTLFDADAWARAELEALATLDRFHEQEPLRPGMLREDLRTRAARSIPPDAWRVMLAGLERAGRVRLIADRVARAGHEVRLSDDDLGLARRIESRYAEAGLDPPDPSKVVPPEAGERAARVLDWLVDRGTLVRIRDGRLFHGPALDRLRRKIREYAKISRTIDVAAFKDLAGVTRKNAIPLLEHLDAERLTRRVGNIREILAE